MIPSPWHQQPIISQFNPRSRDWRLFSPSLLTSVQDCFGMQGSVCGEELKAGVRDCGIKDTAEKCARTCGGCQRSTLPRRSIMTHPMRGAFAGDRGPSARQARRKKPIEKLRE